jgi:hypothetical protein
MTDHRTRGDGSPGPKMTDPLIRAIPAMLDAGIWNHQRLATCAIAHGEPLCERCACRVAVGLLRCVCGSDSP